MDKMDPIMNEKIIVVTGVSSGIGLAVTEKFIKEGWTVFGSVRSETDGNRLQRQFGHNYKPLIIDVTQKQTIVQSVRLVEEYLEGRTLALLVNNAGVAISGPMELITEEEMRYQLDVNVIGCMLVTQLYLPLLKSKDGLNSGKIIHISSISGIFTTPFMGDESCHFMVYKYLTFNLVPSKQKSGGKLKKNPNHTQRVYMIHF